MADQLPVGYWESLGANGPFLQSLFMTQQEQVQQLQDTNTFLQSWVADTHNNITNVASAMASVVAQAISTNPQVNMPVQLVQNSSRSARAAESKTFNGNWDKTKEFVHAIQIAVTIQADTFVDKWMKILYTLSFMCGGTAQVGAGNNTTAVIGRTSQTHTLDKLLVCVERTFGDLDQVRTAHMKLHELKMAQGITAEDYTSQFEMLTGRTRFNNAVLADAYIWGLPNSILQKVFTQTTLPKGLDKWKTVVHNLDRLHRGLMELRQVHWLK